MRIIEDKGYLSVMMVSEKPSIAKTIAEAIGGKPKENRGIHKPCPIWTFDGVMHGYPAQFKVTSVAGHMYERDFPPDINKKRKIDPAELFDANTI